jgi:hypothetical protein
MTMRKIKIMAAAAVPVLVPAGKPVGRGNQRSVARLLRRMLIGLGLAGAVVLSFTPAALLASAAPSLSFTPSSWTAGPIASGTQTSQTFTLTNTGGKASAAITAVTLSGPAAFTKTADTCTGTSLGPDKSCTVTVQYAPASNGESDTATLSASGIHASATASLSGSSTSLLAQAQSDCKTIGGTFSTDPHTDYWGTGSAFLWDCNSAPSNVLLSASVLSDCTAMGGAGIYGNVLPPYDFTCIM